MATFCRSGCSAAGDEPYAHHQRRGHYSEAVVGLPPGERPTEESGMGFTFAEFYRGRRAVFHGGGFAEVGCGVVHGEIVENSQPGPDVDRGEVERWEAEQGELRFRVGNQQREWTSGDPAWRRVAGVHDLHCAVCG